MSNPRCIAVHEPIAMFEFELIAQGYGLVEAPRVDRKNRLLFSDHLYGGVYRRELDGSIRTLIPDRKSVGGMAFGRDDTLIVSGETVAVWKESSGRLRNVFSGHPGRTGRFFNDLTVDEHGSLYVGTVNGDAADTGKEKTPAGDLYRVDPEGKSALVWEGIPASNGLGFSPGGKLLYHANSIPGSDLGLRREGSRIARPPLVRDGQRRMARRTGGRCGRRSLDRRGIFQSYHSVSRRRHGGSQVPLAVKKVVSLVFGGPDLKRPVRSNRPEPQSKGRNLPHPQRHPRPAAPADAFLIDPLAGIAQHRALL